jgi:curved DNA-binding protein CbpA
MQEHFDRLGIAPGASVEDIKAAYHAKLREFPAHSHPAEFKAVRSAYEALRKGGQTAFADLLKLTPIEDKLDEQILAQIKQKAMEKVEVTFADLIVLTF